jgi:hypothetical protein
LAWIHSVCLVAMTFLTLHGSLHVDIYALSHLYSEYGNSFMSDDILLYCISLFIGRFSINVFFVPNTHSTKYFNYHFVLNSYFGGLSIKIIFFTPMTINDVHLSFVFRRIN